MENMTYNQENDQLDNAELDIKHSYISDGVQAIHETIANILYKHSDQSLDACNSGALVRIESLLRILPILDFEKDQAHSELFTIE